MSYPRYVNNVHVGYYIHRNRITWLSDEEWYTLGYWHILSTHEHDARFPTKGKASKNKEKNYSASDQGRSLSPRGGEGHAGGAASSSPPPPEPPVEGGNPWEDLN
eukprot:4501045-Pyramimonas_sp.AAC.1